MQRLMNIENFILAGTLAMAFAVPGCKPASEPAAISDSTGNQPQQADPNEKKSMEATIAENLAKLPPADRQLAEKQRVCPVSGERLGTMDVPPKIDVNGQPVFICCGGCKDMLLEEPEKYLAKLKEGAATPSQ